MYIYIYIYYSIGIRISITCVGMLYTHNTTIVYVP